MYQSVQCQETANQLLINASPIAFRFLFVVIRVHAKQFNIMTIVPCYTRYDGICNFSMVSIICLYMFCAIKIIAQSSHSKPCISVIQRVQVKLSITFYIHHHGNDGLLKVIIHVIFIRTNGMGLRNN